MKVALVHYHLQPGGVTRVIENTIHAWEKSDSGPEDCVVLSGRPYPGKVLPHVRVVEGLDYADAQEAPDPAVLADRLKEAARTALGGLPDLWHIHNHSLGKNPALSGAVARLAQSGARLLLQPHDYAEDGRPENFRNLANTQPSIYPTGGQIHYAALNRRDQLFLQTTLDGHSSPVHLLANAIPPAPTGAQSAPTRTYPEIPENLFLYPVRAVRRKNLGELALLSAAHPEIHFASSLGPTNPAYAPIYESWIEFARGHELGVTYGLGEQTEATFPEMVSLAQAIVNVSVAEGFGLGFLEPWTFGKSLCGRNLPEITADFSELGVNLDNLYTELRVDPGLVDRKELTTAISGAMSTAYASYQRGVPSDAVNRALHSICTEDGIEFGRLNEPLQKRVITQIKDSADELKAVRKQAGLEILDRSRIQSNLSAVTQNFCSARYGQKLSDIYKEVVSAEAEKVCFADASKMLDQFLCPERFNLLRS